ncbi:MAG: dTDP-glucose 4,6-dehydratase [Proteobacteria bacterium]|nr:dTDP-glucose 4,6-dehydratase [Pseudomonadota bacterium]
MKILVTGGCGFIGSNFVRHMLRQHPTYELINLDELTYAGNLENLKDVENREGYAFIRGNICDRPRVDEILSSGVDCIVNFAAESHVDRSIQDSAVFIKTNITGTHMLMEAARDRKVARFIQVSTDEVYGSLGPKGYFTEETPLSPNSPYSASKAAADFLVRASHRTYGFPGIITRCSNNYGPYQFPEKLIPLMITNALEGKELPIYGDGLNVRDWIHVEDHCRAIDVIIHKGGEGEVYNIGGDNERTNIEIVKQILRIMGKPEDLICFVKDRLGHDRRYAIDSSKIRRELGWKDEIPFEKGLASAVQWYMECTAWWKKIKTGEYLKYYEATYGRRSKV